MATLDPATEWRRLTELYGRMSDGELLGLARQKSELTDVAQEVVANEIRQRRLTVQREAPPTRPPIPETQPDSPYCDDRKVVVIATVWSLPDALQLQRLLDRAGIPFVMGPEKATGVDSVTSNFANGVSVGIMNIGLPWARQALQNYFPKDEPEEERVDEMKELPVTCPKCHSGEVIFDKLIGEPPTTEKASPQQFEWTCGVCGHQWKDDGTAKEG